MGRYAYANQPRIALWNLTRLAECLLPLFSEDQEKAIAEAQLVLGGFADAFNDAYQGGLRAKLGLFTEKDGDQALAQDLLDAMAKNQADFTLTFRRLGDAALDPLHDRDISWLFADPTAFDEWAARWRQRTDEEPQDQAARQAAMRAVNPAFIPRTVTVTATSREFVLTAAQPLGCPTSNRCGLEATGITAAFGAPVRFPRRSPMSLPDSWRPPARTRRRVRSMRLMCACSRVAWQRTGHKRRTAGRYCCRCSGRP